MNRLVLIDGNAILHRAYHALPPLTAPDGSVVNAVYGFASILLRLFNDLKPTHMAVAFDRPEPTFRKKMLKAYQAQRPEMEDSLVSQIPKVQDMVRAFGIPMYDAAGFEADDVLATLVEKSKVKSQKSKVNIDEIIIVTGDRDILQLVSDRVKVFMPTKGLSEGKLFGESETKERMGVTPDQIPDLKALMGDSSDNYPGVVGIGPKTAVGLVERFGSIENLYGRLGGGGPSFAEASEGKRDWGDVGETIKAKLLAGKESAFLSKDLATIRTDVPVKADFDKMRVATLDTLKARGKLEEFNFQSLVKRLASDHVIQKEIKKTKVEKPKEKRGEQQELF